MIKWVQDYSKTQSESSVFGHQTSAGSEILPISSISPVTLSYAISMKGRLKVIRGGMEKSSGTS